jgi:predicted nucleic acid-binding protein
MNIVDTSLWLEYFAGTEAGKTVAASIKNTDELIVPTITLYEAFKKILLEKNEEAAKFAVVNMKRGNVISLNDELSINAAKISKDKKLPMADSIIYATALKYGCILWTQDSHFTGLPCVNYFEKMKPDFGA